jgi:hypothetical protein
LTLSRERDEQITGLEYQVSEHDYEKLWADYKELEESRSVWRKRALSAEEKVKE